MMEVHMSCRINCFARHCTPVPVGASARSQRLMQTRKEAKVEVWVVAEKKGCDRLTENTASDYNDSSAAFTFTRSLFSILMCPEVNANLSGLLHINPPFFFFLFFFPFAILICSLITI